MKGGSELQPHVEQEGDWRVRVAVDAAPLRGDWKQIVGQLWIPERAPDGYIFFNSPTISRLALNVFLSVYL